MSTNVKNHLSMLGLKVQDKVTGVEGVVSSIGFDLYGCVQAIVNMGVDKDGKLKESQWFDIARLEILSKNPVMQVPNYDFGEVAEGRKGPAEKPRSFKP